MIEAWFDGACNNVGDKRSGYGALVKSDGMTIFRDYGFIGLGKDFSNNVAEYAGAIAVLRFFLKAGIQSATVYGDSDLVCSQLSGTMKVKKGRYLPYYHEAKDLARQLPDIKFVWIPRAANDEADELSQLGINSTTLVQIIAPSSTDLLFA